jgi:hypothetical protein
MVTLVEPTFVAVTDIVCELFRYTEPKLRFDGDKLSPDTVSVKFCVAVVTTLVAVRTSENAPEA